MTHHAVTSDTVLQKLHALADPALAAHHLRFFKTDKGQYGEGDLFMGIKVPVIRETVKRMGSIATGDVEELLASPWHEARFAGLMFLVRDFKKARTGEERSHIFSFYLAHTHGINNWDLVDCSCRDIVGAYLLGQTDRSVLYRLAESKNLWEQRIAIVSAWTFIHHHQYTDVLALSEKLMNHPHDLMHKAIGWMLRETGKKNRPILTDFLTKHCKTMPRTTLRYAIEHYPSEERAQWMARG